MPGFTSLSLVLDPIPIFVILETSIQYLYNPSYFFKKKEETKTVSTIFSMKNGDLFESFEILDRLIDEESKHHFVNIQIKSETVESFNKRVPLDKQIDHSVVYYKNTIDALTLVK